MSDSASGSESDEEALEMLYSGESDEESEEEEEDAPQPAARGRGRGRGRGAAWCYKTLHRQVKTPYCCSVCDVNLHAECFHKWHSPDATLDQ